MRLGDFVLLGELGRGGMGEVYEARQLSLGRRVAIKVLRSGLEKHRESVRRFGREARAAARLHHDNIVRVHSFGEEAGYHYYAMELVRGRALSRVLAELRNGLSGLDSGSEHGETGPPMTTEPRDRTLALTTSKDVSLSETPLNTRAWFDVVARLVAGVADALEYAHARGVIHRDVKPDNLLLAEDGRLCLADFGLACVAREPCMTERGLFLGTPEYMSPEQIAAGRVRVDHRSDIYSLGTVLYEMLCLTRPFQGESRDEILNAIMTKDPRPPRRRNPRVPGDLQTICQKAMEKDRDLRYQSAAEFAYDLRQYLRREMIIARRPSFLRRAQVAIRRHPTATVIAVAAMLVTLVIGMAWHHSEAIAREVGEGLVADPEPKVGDEQRRPSLAPMGAAEGEAPESQADGDPHGPDVSELDVARMDAQEEPTADSLQTSRPDLIDSHPIYVFR